jgi:hypothetical protein
MKTHNSPPLKKYLLLPGDNQIAPGLNTTQKGNPPLHIRFAHMGPAHGPEKPPFTGHYPHPADPAATVTASVVQRPPPGVNHGRQNRLIPGAGKTFAGFFHRDPVLMFYIILPYPLSPNLKPYV